MKTKEKSKKKYAITYEMKNGEIKNLSIHVKPMTMVALLSVCEDVMEKQLSLQMQITELTKEINNIKQKDIYFKESISNINGYVLKHETELFCKPWWKKFLGL